MAENKIIPWAQTGTANVLSDDAYAADVAKGGIYGDGVKTGQASSQQANKTWRQATAPGSGLSQFLVDNLSVDVTDSDTPDTFSSRIANAVLKLAQISPFNQSWAVATGGYRKYAIVSDSSGNFWVSTADQNTTVPGASGAKWQSLFNGYATQSWSEDRYIRSPANPSTDYRIQTMSRNKVSGGIFAAAEDGSNTQLQPAGDYATNPALSTEASSRWIADNNLQSQINNRVQKTGDTIDWLTITGGSVTTIGYSGNDGVSGGISYATGLTSAKRSGDTPRAIYRFINQNGAGPFATIWLTDSQGNGHELRFGADDRLRTASGNVFALTSEVITQSQYQNDFATSDSRVINLAWGHRIQVFQANVGNGTPEGSWITFPVAFSGTPVFFMANSNGNNDYNTDTDYWCYGANSTGMYVRPRNHNGSANIIAIGPK